MSDTPAFLYVEDDPLSREIMELLFVQVMGYPQLTVWEDSTDFMTKVQSLPTKPKVIFLDIHMLPIDGFSMLKLLRENEAYCKTTVVALTASVMSEEVKMLQTAGFDSCIAKPIDFRSFPETLTRILAGEKIWRIK